MIKLRANVLDSDLPILETKNTDIESVRTLIIPKNLTTEFALQCDEGEILDPVRVVEMYLAQRKYELLESMFARKKERLNSEFCPSYENVKKIGKKQGGQRAVRIQAKHIMQNVTRVKGVYCHSMPDEDAFGKITRHRADIRS